VLMAVVARPRILAESRCPGVLLASAGTMDRVLPSSMTSASSPSWMAAALGRGVEHRGLQAAQAGLHAGWCQVAGVGVQLVNQGAGHVVKAEEARVAGQVPLPPPGQVDCGSAPLAALAEGGCPAGGSVRLLIRRSLKKQLRSTVSPRSRTILASSSARSTGL